MVISIGGILEKEEGPGEGMGSDSWVKTELDCLFRMSDFSCAFEAN